jgi:sirohydrochlorin cobaltochelatase
MIRIRCVPPLVLLVLVAGCASHHHAQAKSESDFGVLVMAHGGRAEWNEGVLSAAAPLRGRYNLEVAFGMADAATIQQGVRQLEERGARKIGVVRLFVGSDSWYDRTEQILGLAAGAPAAPATSGHVHTAHSAAHGMAFWRVETQSSFALSTRGLAEAPEASAILADRARALSCRPAVEDVLVLAHGTGDDGANARWLAHLDARANAIRQSLPFRRVHVETLREDWPDKRKDAEERIRAFVKRASDEGGRAIVIPFRVQGFGPYAKVLSGLDYVADGHGLIPHPGVTEWIEREIKALHDGPFRTTAARE